MALLTVRQVANELNCSVTHVYNLIGADEIDAQNIAADGKRKSWRISSEALERFRNREHAEEVVNGQGT